MSEFDLKLFEAEVRKQYGDAALKTLDAKSKLGEPGSYIPSSCEALNLAIGIGGIPTGRVIEIFGLESGGKTTVSLDFIANYQKLNPKGFTLYFDAENALDPFYAEMVGVDTSKDRFRRNTSNSLEEVSNLAIKAANYGAGMIVIDSIPTLEYDKQLEADEATADRAGGIAKALRAFLKRLVRICGESKTTVILINHITMKVGVVYGNPETTGGGGGPKFYSSVRLDIRAGEKLTDKDGEPYACKTKVKVVKNKVGTPHKTAEFLLVYGEGIDTYADLVTVGQKVGVLVKSGSWVKFGEQQWQGEAKAADAFKKDSKLEAEVRAAVHKALKG